MGFQIRVTTPDGKVHVRKQVYKTKAGAVKKAKWFREHLSHAYRFRVISSHK